MCAMCEFPPTLGALCYKLGGKDGAIDLAPHPSRKDKDAARVGHPLLDQDGAPYALGIPNF